LMGVAHVVAGHLYLLAMASTAPPQTMESSGLVMLKIVMLFNFALYDPLFPNTGISAILAAPVAGCVGGLVFHRVARIG